VRVDLFVLLQERMVFMDVGEGMKKILLAGIGAVATTAESAKDIVDDLVKKGELTVEQGKVVNEELKHKAKDKLKDHVTVNIVKEYDNLMDAVDSMSDSDLELLKEKIKAKEQKDAQTPKDPEENEQ
jgi:polyhydroxyalkanoate synthesis regulator phasin